MAKLLPRALREITCISSRESCVVVAESRAQQGSRTIEASKPENKIQTRGAA